MRVLLLFQSRFLLLPFLLWLLWRKLPKLCWIVEVKVGTLVLFLTLGEMLSIFHHWDYCLLWVCHIDFIMLRYVPSMPAYWRVFIINGSWLLSKAFSASIEIIIWFLSFNLLKWCITVTDLQILKNHCILGIKPTWSWCMTFLICCWILFARILLRIFASMIISDVGL